MAKKKTKKLKKSVSKGMHMMPDGHMMSDAEMKKMIAARRTAKTMKKSKGY